MENDLISELRYSVQEKVVPKILSLMAELGLEEYIIEEKGLRKIKFDKSGQLFLGNYEEDEDDYWDFWIHNATENYNNVKRDALLKVTNAFLNAIDELEQEKTTLKEQLKRINSLQLLYSKQILIEKVI